METYNIQYERFKRVGVLEDIPCYQDSKKTVLLGYVQGTAETLQKVLKERDVNKVYLDFNGLLVEVY